MTGPFLLVRCVRANTRMHIPFSTFQSVWWNSPGLTLVCLNDVSLRIVSVVVITATGGRLDACAVLVECEAVGTEAALDALVSAGRLLLGQRAARQRHPLAARAVLQRWRAPRLCGKQTFCISFKC